MLLGAGVIAYSLMTDYELGVAQLIPMPTHLILETPAARCCSSRHGCSASDIIVWPHVLVGLIEIGTAMVTRRHPGPQTARV